MLEAARITDTIDKLTGASQEYWTGRGLKPREARLAPSKHASALGINRYFEGAGNLWYEVVVTQQQPQGALCHLVHALSRFVKSPTTTSPPVA